MKIIALAFLVITGVLFILQSKLDVKNPQFEQATILSPTKPLASQKAVEVLSGDGTMKITMNSQEKLDGSTDYSFFVSDSSGKNSKLLYSKNVQKGSIEVPKNSWAPDNKYLFLLDREAGDNYVVFKANGDLFPDGSKFIDVSSIFKQKEPSLTLAGVTGWDGFGLLDVRTANTHFWFEVDAQNFVQLAR